MDYLNTLIDELTFHVDQCVTRTESITYKILTTLRDPVVTNEQKIRYGRLVGKINLY